MAQHQPQATANQVTLTTALGPLVLVARSADQVLITAGVGAEQPLIVNRIRVRVWWEVTWRDGQLDNRSRWLDCERHQWAAHGGKSQVSHAAYRKVYDTVRAAVGAYLSAQPAFLTAGAVAAWQAQYQRVSAELAAARQRVAALDAERVRLLTEMPAGAGEEVA